MGALDSKSFTVMIKAKILTVLWESEIIIENARHSGLYRLLGSTLVGSNKLKVVAATS